MDRQGERLQATEPEITERTGAAPPGTAPPSAMRTADLTEPRPQGGVFDSKGRATTPGDVQSPGDARGTPMRARDKAGGANPASLNETTSGEGARAAIEAALGDAGVPLRRLHPRTVDLATEIMADQALSPQDAIERAALTIADAEGLAGTLDAKRVYGEDFHNTVRTGPTPGGVAELAKG